MMSRGSNRVGQRHHHLLFKREDWISMDKGEHNYCSSNHCLPDADQTVAEHLQDSQLRFFQ